jgi:hypothetical protein
VSKSPHLRSEKRIADVIAAIQAMANYKFYKLSFNDWADRIVGDSEQGEHWRSVFEEHPEFFRLDSKREKASLVVRRQHQKLYDVDQERKIIRQEYSSLASTDRISRTPLTSAETSSLISTAIEMHSRAVDQENLKRWWIPLATAVAGFVGAILGAYLSSFGGNPG